jgi:hypothetical protein
MPETEPKIDKKERLAMVGAKIEANILAETAPQPFFSENERQELRQLLVENGVNFAPFREGRAYHLESKNYFEQKDGTHASKFAMVNAALSPDKFRHLILSSLETTVTQPGGEVDKDAETQPLAEISTFAQSYLEMQLGRQTRPRFSPLTQAKRLFAAETSEESGEEPEWAKNVIYRIEAITASAYVLLRSLAYEDSAESEQFQTGKVARKQLRERLVRGKVRSFDEDDPARVAWEAKLSEEKNIRHLPVDTLSTVTKGLVNWPEA